MKDIITVRDGDVIAAEINAIKETTRKIMISGSIEIGRRLVEAKSTVPHGEWGKWLEEKVEYSQSTANNLMQLYREYGEGQVNLFDNWTNSETFGKLSYSQHMALLALPFCERAEFAERVDAESLSTRELEAAVREELEKAQEENARLREKLGQAEEKLQDAECDLEDMKFDLEKARDQVADEKQIAKAQNADLQKKVATAEKDKERAEKSEKSALNLVKKLEKQLKEAQQKEAAAVADLKKAQEHPEIPESLMEQLRSEAEARAAEAETGDIRKQLEEAQAAQARAEADRKAAEERIEALEKENRLNNATVTKAVTMAEQVRHDWNTLNGFRLKTLATDPTKAEAIRRMMLDLAESLKAGVSG